MAKRDDDEMYFQYQVQIAKELGCLAHPNNISDAIRQLKRRAEGHDRKRAKRKARVTAALHATLKAEGFTKLEQQSVADDLQRVVEKLVRP